MPVTIFFFYLPGNLVHRQPGDKGSYMGWGHVCWARQEAQQSSKGLVNRRMHDALLLVHVNRLSK